MKKYILLIIAITLLIFQMVVMATAIDIGNLAIIRPSGSGNPTNVNKGNPANASGKITSIEIYAYSTIEDVKVATFYEGEANVFSTRDYETIGTVLGGAKRTFTVDLDVQEGDYIGMTISSGYVYQSASGMDGLWYSGSQNIPCTSETFYFLSGRGISLYGTGTTEEADNVIFFGCNF